MQIFREGLLEGRSIVLSGAAPVQIGELLEELGARLYRLGREPSLDGASLDALICAEEEASLDHTWATVRTVATEALIPAKHGRIILLGPRGSPGPVAGALENLARTLSVEWARFGITVVAIDPGNSTADAELATLVAFLCSPAGDYYSGCRFELR